jgi:hypothetical protein
MVSRATGSHRTTDNVARWSGAHSSIGGVALPVMDSSDYGSGGLSF